MRLPPPVAPHPGAGTADPVAAGSPVSVAVGSLFELIVGPRGILGTLETQLA